MFPGALNTQISLLVQLAQSPDVIQSSHAASKQEGAGALAG